MVATSNPEAVQTLYLQQDTFIAATLDLAFEALLEELGPESQMPDGKPMPMVLEAWPGGRWFRDVGKNSGHLWGLVQVIKAPTLLEICGPMFMSYAATNHIQYRLAAEGTGTRLKFTHAAIGQIPQEHREGVKMGWDYWLKRITANAERRVKGR